jgi:hypothetical protein
MPSQRYALREGGPPRLEMEWRGTYRDLVVRYDGELVGTVPDRRALVEGQSLRLPDGSMLHVQLVRRFGWTELQVQRAGQPLPGSAQDPAARQRAGYGAVFLVAGLNVLLGLLGALFRAKLLASLGIGLYSIALGAVFFLLGLLTMRGSLVALIAAIAIFALDAVLGTVVNAAQEPVASLSGLAARAFLIVPMARAVPAMRALQRRAERQR